MAWETIDDKKVRHIWVCSECQEKATVSPDWYSDNGTPMCTECDIDMDYDHTEIDA